MNQVRYNKLIFRLMIRKKPAASNQPKTETNEAELRMKKDIQNFAERKDKYG